MPIYVQKSQREFSRAREVSEDVHAPYFVVTDAAHGDVRRETGGQRYPEERVAHEPMLIKHILLKRYRHGEQTDTRPQTPLRGLHHTIWVKELREPLRVLPEVLFVA